MDNVVLMAIKGPRIKQKASISEVLPDPIPKKNDASLKFSLNSGSSFGWTLFLSDQGLRFDQRGACETGFSKVVTQQQVIGWVEKKASGDADGRRKTLYAQSCQGRPLVTRSAALDHSHQGLD